MNKKQKRQQKMLRQQEIVTAAKNAGRDLTAEEQSEFDTMQRKDRQDRERLQPHQHLLHRRQTRQQTTRGQSQGKESGSEALQPSVVISE